MGKSTATVKKLIEFLGLNYRESFSDIPDHISIEFEFMQKLVNREREASQHNDKKTLSHCLEFEKMFIDEHLSQWISAFCDKVVKESNNSFSGHIARLTEKFIEFEKTLSKSA